MPVIHEPDARRGDVPYGRIGLVCCGIVQAHRETSGHDLGLLACGTGFPESAAHLDGNQMAQATRRREMRAVLSLKISGLDSSVKHFASNRVRGADDEEAGRGDGSGKWGPEALIATSADSTDPTCPTRERWSSHTQHWPAFPVVLPAHTSGSCGASSAFSCLTYGNS